MAIDEKAFEDFVFMQALDNAIGFKGKANPKAMIGKVMPKFPQIKEDMSHYMNLIDNIVKQVNSMNLDEQIKKLNSIDPSILEKKKEKKEPNKTDGLPILNNTNKPVIVRFPPAPSGHLHLGHLFGIVANYEFKNKFGGKFILRFEDTNPDNINLDNYEKVIEDVKWICDNNIDEIFYQSDRMDIYYKYLRTLFDKEDCYVCNCDSETFKAYTDAKEECPHRKMSHEDQKSLFENFMKGNFEGVIRAKADLNNKNPALRTFPLARINKNKHARVGNKYNVWPNYNLACAIDDAVMNLTHVIRGKDLEIGEDRQKMIHRSLGLKSPIYFHYGRMKFEDVDLSKTKLTELIEKGKYSGWDDPRVPSILSYRKRGYKAKAFRKFILSLGISKRDSKITSEEYHKGLDFFNKQILEKESDRYFFVYDKKKLHISNIEDYPENEIKIAKHPEDDSKGFRTFKIEADYFIDGIDYNNLEIGDKLRLMHLGNFEIISKENNTMKVKFISKNYSKDFKFKRNIHYVPIINNEEVSIILSDNSKLNGISEKVGNLTPNEAIQYERFGFCKFDKTINNNKVFYFTHR